MPLDIIVGTQWGDEGKGRFTDLLATEADIVARYGGGDNAGHTVSVGGEIFKLHLIPSGVIHDGTTCLIGNGVVVNAAVLLEEIDSLALRGVDTGPGRIRLSRQAHLLTPAHIALDVAQEGKWGTEAIGTTQRGIGPAYADKTRRTGIRATLLEDPVLLQASLREQLESKNETLVREYGTSPLDVDSIVEQFLGFAKRLAPYLVESSSFLDRALADNQVILAEGAQGTFLDLDHGTYPFVTSSNPTAGGALVGLGVGPTSVRRVIGVTKAFTSRVGGGPFPCQLYGSTAERLRGGGDNPWDEYGTTTGRPRRVGWLDLVMVKQAARINGLTELAITKLDILSGLDSLSVCVAYDLDGEQVDYVPSDWKRLARCLPLYEQVDGWTEEISGARRMTDLPVAAKNYVDTIASYSGVPISAISVGPRREQVIWR
jgi:adenylosuccinate synthase